MLGWHWEKCHYTQRFEKCEHDIIPHQLSSRLYLTKHIALAVHVTLGFVSVHDSVLIKKNLDRSAESKNPRFTLESKCWNNGLNRASETKLFPPSAQLRSRYWRSRRDHAWPETTVIPGPDGFLPQCACASVHDPQQCLPESCWEH